jgi:hypothetical protein
MSDVTVEKYGIENIVKGTEFLGAFFGGLKRANADGHIGFEDLGELVKLAPKFGALLDGNSVGKILPELTDMSSEELLMVARAVAQDPNLQDSEKHMAVLQAAFKVARGIIEGVAALKALKE